MHDSDRSNEPATLGGFGYIVALVLCCIIVGGLTYNFGRQNERRQQTPASYTQAAKADAQRACVGSDGTAAFECVYEKVESGQEQARGEQDLTAQQLAANSAFISAIIAFFTLMITGVGAWLIRETLVATQGAVKEAEKATAAANAAVHETTRIGEAQVRCYILGEEVEFRIVAGGALHLNYLVRNSGQSPALDVTWEVDVNIYGSDIDSRKLHQRGSDPPSVDIGGGCKSRLRFLYYDLDLTEQEIESFNGSGFSMSFGITVKGKDVFDVPFTVNDWAVLIDVKEPFEQGKPVKFSRLGWTTPRQTDSQNDVG